MANVSVSSQPPQPERKRINGSWHDRCACGRLKRETSPLCRHCTASEREALRKQRANYASIADGGWVRFPEEY